MTTEEECLAALREAAERLGESPTKAQYEDLGLTPAASTVLRVVGGWNEAKRLAGLDTNPSTGTRIKPKPDDVDLPDGVAWDELSQDQRWHYRNREWNTQRTLDRRRSLREWLHEYKADSDGCTRCGESAPACLDFHHRDPDTKRMAVNEMVTHGYSPAEIRDEIQRCDLLCANCHRREHASLSSPVARLRTAILRDASGPVTAENLPAADGVAATKERRLRAWTAAYQQCRGCRRCDVDDPVVLQFHHVDGEKSAGVGELITNSAPKERVLDEVEHCVVLCANCHRREHYWRDPESGGSDRN